MKNKVNNLILRDHLALDRTNLANERTFLSYVRTSLAFIILGASIIKLLPTTFYLIIGLITLTIGSTFFFFGTYKFYQFKKKINQNYYNDQQILTSQKQNAEESNTRTANPIIYRRPKVFPVSQTNFKDYPRN
ncbi:MAG: DUF202 domain-containing protein [Patescibacteria group bacterium]|jgi:putative membrane protein